MLLNLIILKYKPYYKDIQLVKMNFFQIFNHITIEVQQCHSMQVSALAARSAKNAM